MNTSPTSVDAFLDRLISDIPFQRAMASAVDSPESFREFIRREGYDFSPTQQFSAAFKTRYGHLLHPEGGLSQEALRKINSTFPSKLRECLKMLLNTPSGYQI